MKKRLMINLVASILAFVVQMGISFFLTPKLVEKLGNEAYGFIGLANNFVSYATILTVALNSMASRFIAVEIHKGNQKKANEYYSSVFIADLIMAIIVMIASGIVILNLNHIINIPEYLNMDVKLTFIFVFINFIISLIGTVYNVATFVKNRLDITSVMQIIGNILKLIVLVVLFLVFKPKIYYISIAAIVYTTWVFIANRKITKKIAPELKIKSSQFKISSIKEIISSGIWNSINSLSRVLLTGLDLLIANIFVGANEMGILSIAKTIPSAIESLLAVVGNVFAPQFTILYSKSKIKELVEETNFSIKLLSLMMTVPLAGFIVFGTEFYSLWLPEKANDEIIKIQILSILTLAPYILSSFIYTLFYLDTVTNQLKRPVIFTLIMSIFSTVTALVLLKFTNLGVYAIAGASSIYWCLKMLFFNPINAAYNLKIKLTTFYKPFLRAIGCLVVIIGLFVIVNMNIIINSWISFLVVIVIVGIIGYILNFFLLLDKKERKKVTNFVWDKIKPKVEKIKKEILIKITIIVSLTLIVLLIAIYATQQYSENKYIELKNRVTTNNNENQKYIQFSIDDTIDVFKDLTKYEKRYKTIFQNNELKFLKKMHDLYGVKITLYCYYENAEETFTLDDCTEKFKNDFQENSDWLKLGFHTKNSNVKYDVNKENIDIKSDYEKTINAFYKITGSDKCIDKCVRLQNFVGTYENVTKISEKNMDKGIKSLLCADDDRINYYLSEEENKDLNNDEEYIDTKENLMFLKTDFRLEDEKNIEQLFMENNGEKEIIVFTHEWIINKRNIRKKLEKFLQLGLENEYNFKFIEMNKLL